LVSASQTGPRLSQSRSSCRAARVKRLTLTHVQKRWPADRKLRVQPGLRVGGDRSSNERPEVLILPAISNLVNHLWGSAGLGLELFRRAVGDGIDDFEVFCERTSGNLVIVSWVAPSAEPACEGIVEGGCIGRARAGIYGVE